MKQTAVEFLCDELHNVIELYKSEWEELDSIVKKAKEMEKEQILNTWSAATNPDYEIGFGDMFYILEQEKKAEQYYNETFNTNEK
jgi:hypothetical protein